MKKNLNNQVIKFPPSVYAYCSSAALCANYAKNRSGDETITMDFAAKIEGKRYDWTNKVQFQLTQSELPELTAYMLYPFIEKTWIHRSSMSVVKGLRLKKQPGSILFELSSSSATFRIPVVPKDQYYIRNFLLSRLIAIQPPMPSDYHLNSLKQLSLDLESSISTR